MIAVFAGLMLQGDQPIVNGTGEQERDYVYVGDVARANVLALTKGSGRLYNIGTGVSESVNSPLRPSGRIDRLRRAAPARAATDGEVYRASS